MGYYPITVTPQGDLVETSRLQGNMKQVYLSLACETPSYSEKDVDVFSSGGMFKASLVV